MYAINIRRDVLIVFIVVFLNFYNIKNNDIIKVELLQVHVQVELKLLKRFSS